MKNITLKFAPLFLLLSAFFYFFFLSRIHPVVILEDKVIITDFAYHILLVRDFVFSGKGSIYLVSTQLSMFPGLIQSAMPVGITPIGILLLAPFAYVAKYDLNASQALWLGFSMTVLSAGCLNFLEKFEQSDRKKAYYLFIVLLVLGLSIAFRTSLRLGQTSLLGLGALILLAHEVYAEKVKRNSIHILFYIFLLAIKPTYLLFAFLLLTHYKEWKLLRDAMVFLLFLCFLYSSCFGVAWISEYFSSLSVYTGSDIPQHYRNSIVPETMITFVSAFSEHVGRSQALLVSKVFCTIALFVTFFTAFLKNLNREVLFVFSFSILMLFAPYLGGYEEVLMVFLYFFMLLSGQLIIKKSIAIAHLISLFFILNSNAFIPSKPIVLFWLLKLTFVTLVLLSFSKIAFPTFRLLYNKKK